MSGDNALGGGAALIGGAQRVHRPVDLVLVGGGPARIEGLPVFLVVLIGAWTKTLDRDVMKATLNGRNPFDEQTMLDNHPMPAVPAPSEAPERQLVSV